MAACKIVSIRDTLTITEEMTKSLTERFKRQANNMKSNSSTFVQREKVLKRSLDAVFEQLDSVSNNLNKLFQHYVEEIQKVRKDASELYENIKSRGMGKSTYWSMLRNAKSVLGEIKRSDDCIWIHKTLKILEAQADDLEREMETNFKLGHAFQLEFLEDKGLRKLIKKPPSLGTIRASKIQIQDEVNATATMAESADELESTVVGSSRKALKDRFKFKAACEDESECLLSAISCIDDKILISDNENGRVKLFSSEGALIETINIPDCCGLCVLPKTKSAVVSQPDEQLISVLDVNLHQRPSSRRSSISSRVSSGDKDARHTSKEKYMNIQRVLKTSKKYSVLCSVSSSTFAAASCELPIPGIDIINSKGEIVKSIVNPSKGKPYFKNPQCMSVNSKGVIVIADSALNRLVQINISGEVPEVSLNDTGTRPSGIFVDDDGNSIVCQIDRNTVRYYTFSGENYLLVKKKHRVRKPLAITIDGDYLYLTEEFPSKNVVRFTITRDGT
ncbi:hypothetical protein FSP39_012517 [Pinctada imbricata]|uniref:Uncharacterized protein n=1 Tax=Pinctada imbricata TaxID=66713 RepID=A0AA88XRL6_PINIB|nr:hypothetical protein FSP39_012517 [Pinctada imbricata]